MTEIEDKLLHQFMKQQKQEIPDNGFSRRIMRRLPDRKKRLSDLWIASCTLIGVALFITFGELQITIDLLRETLRTTIDHLTTISIDPISTLIVVTVLLVLLISKLRITSID